MPRKVSAKLSHDQLLSLEALHLEVIAAIEDGTFSYEQCYSWLGSCVLWLFVGVELKHRVGEMQALAIHAEGMLREYHKGKLELDTEDIGMLKLGVDAMAELAKLTSLTLATYCADIAEKRVNKLMKELDECKRKNQQQQSSG